MSELKHSLGERDTPKDMRQVKDTLVKTNLYCRTTVTAAVMTDRVTISYDTFEPTSNRPLVNTPLELNEGCFRFSFLVLVVDVTVAMVSVVSRSIADSIEQTNRVFIPLVEGSHEPVDMRLHAEAVLTHMDMDTVVQVGAGIEVIINSLTSK